MSENQSPWPSAAVAIAILTLIGAVTIAAIFRYPTMDEALQIWQAMAALVGIVTGAVVTYFFTRSTIDNAQALARDARETAAYQERRADVAQQALTKAVGKLPPSDASGIIQDSDWPIKPGNG